MARKKRKGEADDLVAPDAFETVGGSGVSWLESNIKWVLLGAIAILGGILVFEYSASSRARGQSELTADLNDAIEAFGEAVELRTVLTTTTADKITEGYRSAQKKLADFRSKYGDSSAAALAGVYQAELHRRLKEPEKAAPLYQTYLDKIGVDEPLAFMACEGAGYAYEALEQYDKALSYFEKMERFEFAKGYALKHQARIHEAKKDVERAKAIYKELAELDATSPLKAFADERLRMLE